MSATETAKFRRYLRALRRDCPTHLPVRVRRYKSAGNWGHLVESRDGKYLTLVVSPAGSYHQQVETLIHEWAHARAWPDLSHGAAWGVRYAECYRVVMSEALLLRTGS